jgi:hypothetical protein
MTAVALSGSPSCVGGRELVEAASLFEQARPIRSRCLVALKLLRQRGHANGLRRTAPRRVIPHNRSD